MFTNLSLARISEIHPELSRRLLAMEKTLLAEGIEIEIDQSLRTAAAQTDLWQIGRGLPGKIVTHAREYQSNHVIGCAVDISPRDPAGRADWDASHPCWQRIVELAPKFGLRDGKSWHDLPHLELIELPTEPTPEVQDLCRRQGVRAVWDHLAIPEFPIAA